MVDEVDVDYGSMSLKGRILLVEDNKTNQMVMQMLLEDMDLEVNVAENGLKAYEAFMNDSYDLVLMDENMPVMNGIESTKKIRAYEHDKKLVATPIIAVTANVQKGDREQFLKAGMNDYVAKPVDMAELEMTLLKYLK